MTGLWFVDMVPPCCSWTLQAIYLNPALQSSDGSIVSPTGGTDLNGRSEVSNPQRLHNIITRTFGLTLYVFILCSSPVHHHFLRFSTLFTHWAFELAMIQQRLFKAELKGQWIACFNLSIVRTELHFSLRRCISTTSTLVHAASWRQPDNSSRRRSVTLTAVCVGLFIFPLPAVDQETLLGRSAVSQKKEGKQCVCEHLNVTRSSVCIWQGSPFRASRSRPFLWLLNESVPGWALRGHSGDELS